MQPVFQSKFGGRSSPLEEQGNCFQACLASIFDLPLEDAFDIIHYDTPEWWDLFNEWLGRFGLACVYVTMLDGPDGKKHRPWSESQGYHIGRVDSPRHTDGTMHAVVMKGDEVVHDPFPQAKGEGSVGGIYLFVALDAGKMSLVESEKTVSVSA